MITCLHTSQVHVATFAALLPDAVHIVRPDFLDHARTGGLGNVADEVMALLTTLSASGPVLCACSTLGPLVDRLGNPQIVRIDRPAIENAVTGGGRISVAICLDSTRDSTLSLFRQIAAGRATPHIVMCDNALPFFESGDMVGFSNAIVERVTGRGTRVLLAQASMAVAAPVLEAQGVTVFTMPKAAAEAVAALV
ncbi:MAG: hypothetical protein ACSHWY_08785 [Octadecabacter sp.]